MIVWCKHSRRLKPPPKGVIFIPSHLKQTNCGGLTRLDPYNVFVCVRCLGIRHPEELSLARLLSADELKRNQGVSATRRSRPSGIMRSRSRSRSSGGHQQYMSTASILDSVHGSSMQLGSPSGRRTPSMFTSRVRSAFS